MVAPSSEPQAVNESFDREAYHKAAAHTLASLHQVMPPAELTRFSNRPTAEVEALQEQVAQVIPAGNIVGLVLGGLIRVRGRTLPAEQAKSDVSALLRGLEMLPQHILPSTLYGTFFVGPAAVLAGYQKILTLAGKDPESAFPDGLWQFYLEFALREDSARHANETTGFHKALAEDGLNLSPVDELAAWVCAVSQIYFQYDALLANEWRERVYLNLLEQAAQAAQQDRALAFRQLRQAWSTQRPYHRGHDAAPDENYSLYRRRRFDRFLHSRLEALPAAQRNWIQETSTTRLEHELDAYQRQMTLLATLDPDRYRENRTPLPLWQTRIGIIFQDCYYLLPPLHTDPLGQPILFETRTAESGGQVLQGQANGDLLDPSGRLLRVDRTGRVYEVETGRTRGYLHPIPFQAVRRHIAAIFNHFPAHRAESPAAQLDEQLICIRRTEQERARKTLHHPLVRQELAALKSAPILINWTEQDSAKPLAYIRQGKRGIGDHALTIFHANSSMIFDQSHIFFDGTWGMALAEILTGEAVAWATYFSDLPPLEPAPQIPYHLRLAAEPSLEKFSRITAVEAAAENTAIDMKALYALRKLLSKRHPDLKTVNTVNDLLLLYRCHFGHFYRPSTAVEDALFELRALNTPPATEVYDLISEILAKSQASNPAIMMPMDASAASPRERLCPTTFRNPFSQLWSKYESACAALADYTDQQTAPAWAVFNDARYSLLVQLDHFGQLLRAHKGVALEGESTSLATMKLMAHLPDSLLTLLDQIPRRIDVLNEVIKGEEVFSNVGRVARGSSLTRFISAKDDNENKTLVWGFLTDDRDVLHLSLRDFRPHVAALQQLGKIDLAELMLKDYLDSFAQGFNEFVARLLDLLNATATHSRGIAA
ncbi:MAG: hypothetical protein BroJett011_05940 [Chloroflexota bacterium]|nr:MAG: hypothetical protein BroJett011_05940 [Chloroflexota bacterium]